MLKTRASGVLMHISSIPSPYGIGVFDENCRHFADTISDMYFKYWQVLPFNPVDKSNSPYCSASTRIVRIFSDGTSTVTGTLPELSVTFPAGHRALVLELDL